MDLRRQKRACKGLKEHKVYLQTTLLFPGIGKAPELSALLVERIRQQQSEGQRVGLQMLVYGPNAPALRIARQFDDLAALETFRSQPPQLDPRVAALFRQPVVNALYEQLLTVQPGGQTPKFTQRFFSRPLPGKAPELAALLVEYGRRAQTDGYRTTVTVQVAGNAAGAVVSQTLYGSLIEIEKRRMNNRTSPAQQELLAKLGGLAVEQPGSAISEVLVSMTPR